MSQTMSNKMQFRYVTDEEFAKACNESYSVQEVCDRLNLDIKYASNVRRKAAYMRKVGIYIRKYKKGKKIQNIQKLKALCDEYEKADSGKFN